MTLNLSKSKEDEYTEVKHNENNYKYWREHRKDGKQPFLMVPSEILNYLKSIHTRAISLYLYYCSRAGNNTGKSWAAVETAAKELDISTKSVNNWNRELEELGLIARINEGKSSKTTYLLPISNYTYFEKNTDPATFIEKSHPKIDGELISVFHLFQWRKEDTEEFTKPYNVTALVFQRSYEIDDYEKRKFAITKAVFFEEEKYEKMSIDKKNEDFLKEEAYQFDTEKRPYALEIETFGIAVSSKINLKETKKENEVVDLINQLVEGLENENIKDLPKAEVLEDTN